MPICLIEDQKKPVDQRMAHDAEMLAELEAYRGRVCAYLIVHYRLSRLDADNLVTEAIERTALKPRREEVGDFGKYLHTVARNLANDWIKFMAPPPGDIRPGQWSEDPSDLLMKSEDREQLYRCIARLPWMERVIVRATLRGVKQVEVAERTNESPVSINRLFKRAKKDLLNCFSSPWQTGGGSG